MIERVERLPRPQPDFRRLLTALRRGTPDRVPLIELAIDEEIITTLRGGVPMRWRDTFDSGEAAAFARDHCAFWRRLGYDYVRVFPRVVFELLRVAAEDSAALSRGQRQWADSTHGAVESMEDLERYAWPRLTPDDFRCADALLDHLPEGMTGIGWSGGVLEFASQLMGIERFFLATCDDPDFIQAVIDRVGQVIYDTFQVFCGREEVRAVWLGDDLGGKNGTLVDPAFLRERIFPWYRQYADLAHATGRLFLLHSCGNLASIMDDLADLGVDAKHSFEDVIMPVEDIQRRWGHRMAILGGVDVDLLSRGSEDDVRVRTEAILQSCAPEGGYACGSGNSIANYVRPGNYLSMIETVHHFNRRL